MVLTVKDGVYFSFTNNKDITYGEYALNIEEYKGYYE